jgi:peptidoglycan glycosyltransferase
MTRERNTKKYIRKEIYVVAVLFMLVFIAMAVYLGFFVKDGSREFI